MSAARRCYQGLVIDVLREQVELPNGARCELEIVKHPGGAAVVALDAENRVCLLRQYRHVVGGWLWELPAGKIDNCEDPRLTAQRELREEAGCQAARWTSLGIMHSSPGIFAEVIHLYAAQELTLGEPAHEEHEVLEVTWIPFTEAQQRIVDGEISDAKSIAALCRAQRLVAG